ncbi:hypothetical protein FACS1894214_0930 [Planctomycetales bacterium]|nr:hypothetical protein FACS1894214_0930 [Planctomycetales bacterium]
MEEVIILTPDESLVINPGEELKPSGDEPLRITFGLLHFPLSGGGQQEQVLNAVKEYLRYAVPNGWTVETAKHLRINAENTAVLVQIVPNKIVWKRSAKGRQYTEHEINVVLTGMLETDFAVALLNEWAKLFLDGGGPFDDIPCMGAETLLEAEAGYDADALTDTPSRYYGGLRLTFWGD